jgi:sporulation protein YlmC with PRC-barrel domain
MIKTLVASAAICGLMMSGALAQSADTAASSSPKFVASQSPDQWVFSKFKGTDVVGPNDETIGSVSDLLFDKSGKIMGMMVGVGGFLGIGQKNVAIDMSGFQVVPASAGLSTTMPSTSNNDPTDVKLKVAWTKDQLQQAPDFQYYKPPSSSASSDRPATTGMAPRSNAPAIPAPPRP